MSFREIKGQKRDMYQVNERGVNEREVEGVRWDRM
jgi:hypothetical protein